MARVHFVTFIALIFVLVECVASQFPQHQFLPITKRRRCCACISYVKELIADILKNQPPSSYTQAQKQKFFQREDRLMTLSERAIESTGRNWKWIKPGGDNVAGYYLQYDELLNKQQWDEAILQQLMAERGIVDPQLLNMLSELVGEHEETVEKIITDNEVDYTQAARRLCVIAAKQCQDNELTEDTGMYSIVMQGREGQPTEEGEGSNDGSPVPPPRTAKPSTMQPTETEEEIVDLEVEVEDDEVKQEKIEKTAQEGEKVEQKPKRKAAPVDLDDGDDERAAARQKRLKAQQAKAPPAPKKKQSKKKPQKFADDEEIVSADEL